MSITPRWYNRLPGFRRGDSFSLNKFFEDFADDFRSFGVQTSGISVSSDEKNIYVDADVPGLTAKEVDVSIDQEGLLWIKGEKKEEDQTKKYYRKSHHSFSYCIPLWDEVDEKIEPQATCKDGIMHIVFAKKKEKQIETKKIKVRDN